MSSSIDASDFGSIFMSMPHPSCMLEPVTDAGGILIDVLFRHTNAAFDREYLLPADQRNLVPLMLREGIDGTSFFRMLDGMQTGASWKFSFFVRTVACWFGCRVQKLPTGNFLIVVEYVTDKKSSNDAESVVDIELPEDADRMPVRLVINPLDGTVLDASVEACVFYGYSRLELQGMAIRELIVSYDSLDSALAGESDARPVVLARHRRADGKIIEARSWSFISRWNGGPAVFTGIDSRDTAMKRPLSRGKRLRDRLGRLVDETIFEPFIESHADIPFLCDLLASIIPHGVLVNYSRGSHFYEYGEISPSVGFILQGVFRQYALSPDGKDCTIDFYGTGRFLDSYTYIKLNRPCLVAFEARSDCLVYSVDLKVLKRLTLGDYRWYRLFYYNLLSRLVSQNERDYSLLCEDAMSRYNRFIAQHGKIAHLLKSYHIASYLGITSETLSRIRKNINEDIIEQ